MNASTWAHPTGARRRSVALRSALVLAVILVVAALIGEAGIVRTGISGGRILAFDSIVVNNREIDISGATITIDDEPATEADLRLGQIVEVEGEFFDETAIGNEEPINVAIQIEVKDNVEGTVDFVDANNNRLTVLGQAIVTDGETIFDLLAGGQGLSDIQVGDVVEISGIANATAEILATRIEQQEPGGEFEVNGVVAGLNPVAMSFSINGLTVDFSNAELEDFPGNTINAGDLVEAEGTSVTPGILIATKVEFETGVTIGAGQFADFGGLITQFVSPEEFSLGGLPVTTNAATVFENGGPANLTTGIQLEVAGLGNTAGAIVASRVRIIGSVIKVEAPVNYVGLDGFEVLGIEFADTDATRWRDKSDADVSNFSLAHLAIGDFVEVRSIKDPGLDTPIDAERVRREDTDDEVELQGFVTRSGQQAFEVMGVTIDVSGDTEYETTTGDEINASSFFQQAIPGTLVKVEGEQTDDRRISAEEIEFE